MLRSQTLTVARAAPIQFLAHWLFTPRRDTLRRMIKIANSGVVNFISWHRAEFRPARGRSISSSGGTAAASVGSDVRFVTKTAKPSARESAGGFAFVPATCRIGDIVGLSKNGVPPLRLFYGGKMQNCRRRASKSDALFC